MPKSKVQKGPGGVIIDNEAAGRKALYPMAGYLGDYAVGSGLREIAKQRGMSALAQGATKAATGIAAKGLPAVALAAEPQASYNAMVREPWIDESMSQADYMARKAGKPMGVQYPTGKRGPSYVKPSYPGQSNMSKLMDVKNPKR